MNPSLAAVLAIALAPAMIFTGCAGRAASNSWLRGSWNGEAAWVGDSGRWRAVVSEERGRLIYLGLRDKGRNLLSAPAKPEGFAPRGGHLFWLGPQREWNRKLATWPPRDDWEFLPAERVRPWGNTLWMTMSQPQGDTPFLRRSYRWKDGALLSRCSWSGGKGDFQAIQIFQLPFASRVEVRRGSDFVRFDAKGKHIAQRPAVVEEIRVAPDGSVHVTAGKAPRKFAFRPQELVATTEPYRLVFARVAVEGIAVSEPDGGFNTQVFLGDKDLPVVEVEQLSPRLKNRGAVENAFTVSLRPELR